MYCHFNIHNSTFCPHNVCVLCGSQNKQRLFPCTVLLTGLYSRDGKCLLRGKAVCLYIIQVNPCPLPLPERQTGTAWERSQQHTLFPDNNNNYYISVFQLIALNIFYKQHIKTYVLSKTLKISPTCFGHLATILRETQYLSLLQLLKYRCSSMPAASVFL